MRKQYCILLFLLPFFYSATAQEPYQIIYEIKYRITPQATGEYTALLINSTDGRSLMRIMYFNPLTKQKTVFEPGKVKIAFDESGENPSIANINDNLKPNYISGPDKAACITTFIRMTNNANVFTQPDRVILVKNAKIEMEPVTSFKLLRVENLDKAYVEQFFKKKEHFYITLFNSNPKIRQQVKSNPWVYFISVANVDDKVIGIACKKDAFKIGEFIHTVSAQMEWHLEEVNISGKNYNKQNVQAAINGLKPLPQDIVFFYYSGHGFNFKNDSIHAYPQLDLRSSPPVYSDSVINASTLNLDEIFSMIRSKGANFNLVTGDCCNSFIEFYRHFPNDKPSTVVIEPVVVNKQNARMLFLHRSSILIAAAKKGQYSITDDLPGSIFTDELCGLLQAYLYAGKKKPDGNFWEAIINKAQVSTRARSTEYDCGNNVACVQEPIYKMER